MMNDECGMMNEKQAALVKFITHHSAYIIYLYVIS
jgi:hypothetical protein